MMDIVTGVKWYFIVVWICISLIISEIECLFVCFWLSLKKYVFRSSNYFFHIFKYIKVYEIFVYFEDWSLVGHFICKDFLTFCGLSLHFFLMVSFALQNVLRLESSHLFIFVFIFITLGDKSKERLPEFPLWLRLRT